MDTITEMPHIYKILHVLDCRYFSMEVLSNIGNSVNFVTNSYEMTLKTPTSGMCF